MAATRFPLLPLRFRVASFVCAVVATVSVVTTAQLSPLAPASQAYAVCAAPLVDCTSGSVTGGGVTLIRKQTTGGTAAQPAKKTTSGTLIVVPPPPWSANVVSLVCAIMVVRPWYCPVKPTVKVTPATAARPAVTLSDLAAFVPQSPGLLSEPSGWALVGLPANFMAIERTHDVSGSLLGSAATVRFTPVSFVWSYGDGSNQTTTSAGVSWASLGQAAFSPTPTSHIFTRAGTFVVRVSVLLRASYRVGSGSWVPVSGTLTRTATISLVVSQGSVPVLVSRGCLPKTAALGC